MRPLNCIAIEIYFCASSTFRFALHLAYRCILAYIALYFIELYGDDEMALFILVNFNTIFYPFIQLKYMQTNGVDSSSEWYT